METLKKFFWLLAALLCLSAGTQEAWPSGQPTNKVVLIIDGSDSFKSRQAKAIAKATELLDSIRNEKRRRWEGSSDTITIISLDACPDVVWSGSLQDLKTVDPKGWIDLFHARQGFSACTDLDTAISLALRHLVGDPQTVSKYMFIFSDLIHDPPTDSVRHCQKPRHRPPETFPWEELRDVSVTVFWCPPNQKHLWTREVKKHRLQENFAIHSSESAEVSVPAPPPPRLKVSESEKESAREVVGSFLKWLAIGGLSFVGFILLVVLVRVAVARFRTRHSRQSPPPQGNSMGQTRLQGPAHPQPGARRSPNR